MAERHTLSYTWICPLSSNTFSSLFSTEFQNKLTHLFIHSFNSLECLSVQDIVPDTETTSMKK